MHRLANTVLAVVLTALAFGTGGAAATGPGSVDTGFDPSNRVNGLVACLALQPDGKVIIGGNFTNFNGLAQSRIGRLNADGTADSTFLPGAGADAYVRTLLLDSGGRILVGGYFTNISGLARRGIARLNPDGSGDATFDPGTGVDTSVSCLALQADGQLLIGGSFSNVNNSPHNRLARLSADGVADPAFTASAEGAGSAPVYVSALTVQPDGKILVAGNFTKLNSVGRNAIARLNADGTLDETFDPGTGANDWIWSLALASDGRILAGGYFTNFNGASYLRVVLLQPNGLPDPGFKVGSGASDQVFVVALDPNNKPLIGGAFVGADGELEPHFARLDTDGSFDFGMNTGTGASDQIDAIALQPDGSILVGGAFTNFNGAARRYVARLVGGEPAPSKPTIKTQPVTQSVPAGGTFTLTVVAEGTPPFAYQWLKTGVSIPDATNSAFSVTNAQPSDSGSYKALIVNAQGLATSLAAVVTVTTAAPKITKQPGNLTVNGGGNATFSVSGSGAPPPVYQWLHSGTNLIGATNATLTLTNVLKADGGGYTVLLSNDVGSVMSSIGTLTVKLIAPTITLQPTNQLVTLGYNATFLVLADGAPTPSYQWRFNGAVLDGATNYSLTLSNVTLAEAGSYFVTVTNEGGATNSATVKLSVFQTLGLAEALNTTNLIWTTGGGVGWTTETNVTHDRVLAAKSGPIGDSQDSWLSTTVTGPGTLRFWWKVSSEEALDLYLFYIDGVLQTNISGEVDWQAASFEIASGSHALNWQYSKDGSTSVGQDSAWLDEVSFTPGAAPQPFSLASPQILPNGSIETILTGESARNYAVQVSADLFFWTSLTNVTLSNTTATIIDSPPNGALLRFYRAQLLR